MPQLLQDIAFIVIVVAGFATLLNWARGAFDRRDAERTPFHDV